MAALLFGLALFGFVGFIIMVLNLARLDDE